VGQINSAVGQLNQTTQQNASSSEELAATSEEMSGQAEQLQQTMSFFKLDEHGSCGHGIAPCPQVSRKGRVQPAAAGQTQGQDAPAPPCGIAGQQWMNEKFTKF
jgi:methyl-accepting chemotaxis protein